MENGTKQTLDGLIDILEKAADTKGTSDKLKDANEDLRASVKDELDKIEDDTNLLEIDPSQSMISFTSDKNPSPASIQIILRTEEILSLIHILILDNCSSYCFSVRRIPG